MGEIRGRYIAKGGTLAGFARTLSPTFAKLKSKGGIFSRFFAKWALF